MPSLFSMALSLLFLLTLAAQTVVPATPFDPREAVTQALHRLEQSDNDVRRFTYMEKMSMATVARDGRLVYGTTRRYEVTYINDRQYLRLMEVDDKPLSGPALKEEQKRYDKAIAKRRELDTERRASSDDFMVVKPDFDLASLLGGLYTLKEVSVDKGLDGDTLHHVDAALVPGVKNKLKCPWHVQLWISAQSGILTRYVADAGKDMTPSCAAAGEEKRYIVVDDMPKLSVEGRRLNVQEGNGFEYVPHVYVINYTEYRRFHTTVTLGAAKEVPSEESPAQPADPPK